MWELVISIVCMIAGYVFHISPLFCAAVSFFAAANIAWWMYKENEKKEKDEGGEKKKNKNVLYVMFTVLLLCSYSAFCLGVVFTVHEIKYINNDNGSIDKDVTESQEIYRLRAELSADREALSTKLKEANAAITTLSTDKATQAKELREANETIAKKEAENNELSGDLSQVRAEYQAYRENTNKNNLSKELEQKNAKITNLEAQNKAVSRELSQAKATITKLKAEKRNLEKNFDREHKILEEYKRIIEKQKVK